MLAVAPVPAPRLRVPYCDLQVRTLGGFSQLVPRVFQRVAKVELPVRGVVDGRSGRGASGVRIPRSLLVLASPPDSLSATGADADDSRLMRTCVDGKRWSSSQTEAVSPVSALPLPPMKIIALVTLY